MPKVIVSNEALRDLTEIFDYLAENDFDIASAFLREMARRFDMVAANPSMGAAKSDLMSDLRMFPFRRYNIFYFKTADHVEIYRVLHSSRDIVQLFDQVIDGG